MVTSWILKKDEVNSRRNSRYKSEFDPIRNSNKKMLVSDTTARFKLSYVSAIHRGNHAFHLDVFVSTLSNIGLYVKQSAEQL